MTSNEPSTEATPKPTTEEARQAVTDATQRGAQMAGGNRKYLELTQSTLKMVGLELARNVEPGERSSICLPAEVAHDGRYDPGMVLLLDKRVVLAWFEGTLKVTRHSRAFALADISEVAKVTRDRGRLAVYREAITFAAGGARYEFVLPSKAIKGMVIDVVSGVLSGTVNFDLGSKTK
jgi:hypothetical protein